MDVDVISYLGALGLGMTATVLFFIDRKGVVGSRVPRWTEAAALTAGLAAALGAGLLILLSPTWRSAGGGSPPEQTSAPVRAVVAIAVITLLAGLPLLATARRRHVLELSVGWLMLIFSFVTGFSIGLLYVPVACLLFVAAAFHRVPPAPS